MNHNISTLKVPLLSTFFSMILSLPLLFPSPALPDHPVLQQIITAYNLKANEKSLIDGTYRGEEGILRIKPEIAQTLEMTVLIDKDYLDSRELFKKADKFLEKARMAMVSQNKEKLPGEHAQKIADNFLISKKALDSAKKRLISYRSRLSSEVDDRLNRAVSAKVMTTLLKKSIKKTENQLRDALGCFYNICQGVSEKNGPLTPENVRFVNGIFRQFIGQAPEKALNMFDLDRDIGYRNKNLPYNWKNAVGKEGSQYIPLLEAAFKKSEHKTYAVDPLLFMALMRRESSFDSLAISHVGAAGLTQIMPKTARTLGMRNIYMPGYFNEAISFMQQERKTRAQAMDILFQIDEKNRLHHAAKARELMQKSLVFGWKKERLFARYRKKLLQKRNDDRLQPEKAIEYGLNYFAGLMRDQKGDISLALASYNAGPHRVEEFKGIPPYEETVHFRNRVLQYYREYLKKGEGN